MEIEVGRVIRSSTTRFAVGCQVLRPQVPVFGALVKVPALGDGEVYGLIHDVRMEDDPFVRQMAAAHDDLRPEYVEDMRRNRQVPIEVNVLVVGYSDGGAFRHRLPPHVRTRRAARLHPAVRLLPAGLGEPGPAVR